MFNADAAVLPHSLRFSTDDLPAKDRLPHWREFFGRGIARLDIEPLTDTPFRSTATFTGLPDLRMMSIDAPGAEYRRTPKLLADGADDTLLTVIRSGAGVVAQCGRRAEITQGDAIVMSCGEVGSMRFPQATQFLTLRMPLRRLKPAAPNIEDRIAERIPRDNPALRLLTSYVEVWQQGELATTPELARVFASHIHDLFALVVGAGAGAAEMAAQGGGRAARLALVRPQIDNGVADPDFSLPVLARRIGASPRYVQMLLEEADSSFVKEVTDRRLQRARDLLCSLRHRHLCVIDIACECGFSSVAHFHRLFRRRYDATPGDWRARLAA
jgi:AraC-like DNA-binding protein